MNISKNILGWLFIGLIFCRLSPAADQITITTYYPSPYGVYKELRLNPIPTASQPPCNNNLKGTMYYDKDKDSLYVCSKDPTSGNTGWIPVPGGDNLYWVLNSSNDVYNINSSGRVGIGTTSPAYKLDVKGNITNSLPTAGYISLSGDLPGYSPGRYPTLKTNGSHLYISVHGLYSAYVDSGGIWHAHSGRAYKENFVKVNPSEVLEKIERLPMYAWNYKGQSPACRHIAPVAEDFFVLFDIDGKERKMISSTDTAGIALVGVQALAEKISRLITVIESQKKRIEELELEVKKIRH